MNRQVFSFSIKKIFFFLVGLYFPLSFLSQPDSNYVLNFNFNDHQIREADNKLIIKPIGISLAEDRFGNKQSAIYLHGHAASYLNLGTSNLLKPKEGTISLWVNLDRRVYTGKGYDNNPIIMTKNGTGDDFYDAYIISYECYSNRFGSSSTKDSTKEVIISSLDEVVFGKWYHLVITYDDDYFAFYVNGNLQQKYAKGFETVFLKADSVIIGNTANKKNDRWTQGIFDDIRIFHRVLNEREINELFKAPNPNRAKIIWNNILIGFTIGGLILLLAYALVAGRRKSLKKEEEKFKLNSKLHEMETKVIKAQMNPHFMFNSLNTIQQFIITNENEKALFYLSKFSRLIRKLLENTTKDNVSLEDEISMLNRYLEIESLRFNNVFKYDIEADKKIDKAKIFIPHFMVQPFVENAIWHGLLTKDGDKNLKISFELIDDQKIACTIDDDGVGRKLKKTTQDPEKKSLAINFIRQRLDLINKMMKRDYDIRIVDKKNSQGESEGTKIIITLPILKNN